MDKPLFRYRAWAIFKASEEDIENGTNVYGIHMTCKKEAGKEFLNDLALNENVSWMTGENPPKCWNCHVKVPDPIQALIHLHEWDNNDS